jgi:hypothetical protein
VALAFALRGETRAAVCVFGDGKFPPVLIKINRRMLRMHDPGAGTYLIRINDPRTSPVSYGKEMEDGS